MTTAISTFRQLDNYGAKINLINSAQQTDLWSWYLKVSESETYLSMKRLSDVIISALAMLALSPIMLIVAVLIKLESRGPVLFSQERVGKDGKIFKFWKFRSMSRDAESLQKQLSRQSDLSGVRFKMASDPRITGVGKIIRKLSIDELPQLWNVLVGDMSLVGPRPPLPVEVAQYNLYQRRRLAVTPGLTCTWQIGGRSDLTFQQQVDMDLDYIRKRSIVEDFKILCLTPLAVLSCRGAY